MQGQEGVGKVIGGLAAQSAIQGTVCFTGKVPRLDPDSRRSLS
jgi:hypothetical protein